MNKKTKKVLIGMYLVAFSMMLIGSTMAFFTVIKTSTISPKGDITSVTTTSIIFEAGNPITILASDLNFAQGDKSLSDSTYASATIKVGSDGLRSVQHYNVSLELPTNELIYSTPTKTPELILNVKDPNGKELKNIPGLKYVTSNGYSGFDVTDKNGKFMIAENYEIATDSVFTQKWDITLTFVNLNQSQDQNLEKELKGIVKIEGSDIKR